VTIATGARVRRQQQRGAARGNDGTTDALAIDGTVRAGNVLNLRPGGVDAAGNARGPHRQRPSRWAARPPPASRCRPPSSRGSTPPPSWRAATRMRRTSTSWGRSTLPSALTLQNGGGGNIQLGGALTATKIGLLSRGNITQTAGAPITAGTLMARSTGGSVLLDTAPNNVSAATVGGGAAGAFRYVDVDTVQLGSVSVTGYDAAGNAPQVQSATSMAADTVFVRTLSATCCWAPT
jgi:hypothetical protein